MTFISFFQYFLCFSSFKQLYVACCVSKCQQNCKMAIKFAISKKEDSSLGSLLFLEM